MNAPVSAPAFAHMLPPKGPTLFQLALSAIAARKAQRDHLFAMDADDDVAQARQDRIDAQQHETAQTFFAALEAETGIDRRLFELLGDVL